MRDRIKKILREQMENNKGDDHNTVFKYLKNINKKYPPNENETNVITLEGNDLVTYQIWEEQWENSDWTELERITIE